MARNLGKSTQPYSSFDPRTIPDCSLWLDADDTSCITLSSTSVTAWKDKSRTSNNAASVSGNYPTYTATQNNRKVISFNGSQYFSLDISKLPTGTSSFSVFIVGQTTTTVNTQMFLRWGGTTTGSAFQSYIPGSSLNRLYVDYLGTTGSYITDTIANTYLLFSHTATTSATNPYLNGRIFTNITNTSYNIGTNTAFIGTSGVPINSSLTGNIGEIIIFNRDLTTTERQQVEGYLAWKWGLQTSLPNNMADISGCVLWLDAADTSKVTLSGSNVTQWTDKSTSANNATASAGSYPTYTLTQNSKNVISFNGSSQFFTLTANKLPTGTSGFSVFIIGNINNTTGLKMLLAYGAGTTGNGYQLYANSSTLTQDYYNTTVSTGPSALTSSYFIVSQTSSTTVNNLFQNGSAFSTNSVYSYNIGTTAAIIGRQASASQYFLNGNIGEIIVYNRSLTFPERIVVETYLSSKWAVTIASTISSAHPYISRMPFLSYFRPTDISNCALWFDAADTSTITTVTGSPTTISSWSNKGTLAGAVARNGTQTCTTGSTVNGLNYVRCPAGNDLRITVALNTQARSWFFVSRQVTTLTSGMFSGIFNQSSGSGRDGVIVGYVDATNYVIYNGPAGIAINVSANVPSASMNNTVYMGSIINSATVGLNVLTFNGQSQTLTNSAAAGSFNTTSSTYRIGSDNYNTTLDIMEIILYYGDLSSGQRQLIEGYLAWKWGLQGNLPVTHQFNKFYPLKVN